MKRPKKIDRSMLCAHDMIAVSNLEDYTTDLEKRNKELENYTEHTGMCELNNNTFQ